MSATDVSICSNALLMLGAQSINDLTEDNDRARLASNLYPTVRDGILSSHPWKDCITRVALSPDTAAPAFDWAYQYTLPGDFIQVLGCGELGLESEFRIEGGKLLCDENPLYLRYVYLNTNPATWDGMLVSAVTLSMAAAMAYGITQSAALGESLAKQALYALKQAKANNGQADSGETLGDFRLQAARFGSMGSF
jgi:hypothetical protein